ncbi:SDR family NAD(P)-dependent oxidoreductase [Nocardioides sp. NPDC051685]|uniref:SDR family NAD(P)-dependent oxidoreductase n=1 Tax=Nocardioides sp. NPDC051685 TaxID=3364334 RepID=UPI0037999279
MTDTTDIFRLDGRKVILTGASVGIGRRMAEVLVGAGATVTAIARREPLLRELSESLGGRIHTLSADLSDPAQARDAARGAIDVMGGIDVLVNNAAYIAGGVRAEDESLEDIQRTLDVNLVAPIVMAQTVYPLMREQGAGSIVSVSSMVASVGIGRLPQAVYSASKGGLNAITREWAAQWSRFGIRVNALAPGFIETEMTSEIIQVPKIHDWITSNTLLSRPGRPDDFDGALLFLASDASSYVTGQVITVDGGWTAR